MKNIFFEKKIKGEDGFTLIELLVATSLFAVVAIGAVSILLSSQAAYKKLSNNRTAIDNINLVLNTMSREIKFGSRYGCINNSGDFTTSIYYQSFASSTIFGDSIANNCNAIVFSPQGATSTKTVYYLDVNKSTLNEANYELSGNNYTLQSDFSMISPDLSISSFWFKILGTANDDYIQPSVEIYISSIITILNNVKNTAGATTTFIGEAVISQKILDN